MPRELKEHPPGERNIKLTIEYDGTDFSGWQVQREERTVQGEIEGAIAKVTDERLRVKAAGRTDAGVHAVGQVANFFTRSVLPAERIAAALNAKMGADVAITAAEEAPLSFDAGRDAVGKLYRYRIWTRRTRPVLERRCVSWVRADLDAGAMRKAAGHLVGTHDFNSFRGEGKVAKNTVRTVEKIDFDETPDEISISFVGTGFLYMMVRIMAGTLLEVGRGGLDAGEMPAILAACDRDAAGPTAPPEGLCLVEVYY